MARAGLVHHDRSHLKKELQDAEDEWRLLQRRVKTIDKVRTVERKNFYIFRSVLSLKVNE